MRPLETTGLTVEQVQAMARRELSMPTRIGYLLLLMLTLMGAGLISTLWVDRAGTVAATNSGGVWAIGDDQFGVVGALRLGADPTQGVVRHTQRDRRMDGRGILQRILAGGVGDRIDADEYDGIDPRRSRGIGSAVCRNYPAKTFAATATRIASPSP